MPVPTAFHTCRESRSAVVSNYERAFTYGAGERYIWVNFDLDIISIDDTYFERLEPEALRIRQLMFSRDITEEFVEDEIDTMAMFSNAQEIIVECNANVWHWYDYDKTRKWPCPKEIIWFTATTFGIISLADYQALYEKKNWKRSYRDQNGKFINSVPLYMSL